MRFLRVVLTILSVFGALLLLGFTADILNGYSRVKPPLVALIVGGALTLIVNAFYLFRIAPKGVPSRLARLFSLWIDAKEQELKDRVSRK